MNIRNRATNENEENTSNTILDISDDDNIKIKPTRVYLYRSMPCEKACAKAATNAQRNQEKNNTGLVAYSFLQNREEYNFSRSQILLCVFFIGFAGLLVNEGNKLNCSNDLCDGVRSIATGCAFIMAIASFTFSLPNIANANRYRKTTNDCEAWLGRKIGEEQSLKSIKSIKEPLRQFSSQLLKVLEEAKVDTQGVKEVLEKKKKQHKG